jgi:DNA adenine methylase
VLRDRVEDVILALDTLAAHHRKKGESFFYEVRDRRFNPARAAMPGVYTPALAAMLIYLNRTGFNGLFRLNRRGAFNVPVGRYDNPRICDPAHLRRVAAALRAPGVTIELGSFTESIAHAGPGTFVYCDPPYAPLSKTASFASYTADGFGPEEHERLRDGVVSAGARGAAVLVSNSSAPFIEALYTSAKARHVGLHVVRVGARRAINSRATSRGPVDELLITNVGRSAASLEIKPKMAHAALRAHVRQVV